MSNTLSLTNNNVTDIETRIINFVKNRIPESQYLDYKRELSRDKILDNIAGMANGGGGEIIIGIEESEIEKDIPDKFVSVKNHNDVITLIKQSSIDNIVPKISLDIKHINIDDNDIISIKVPSCVDKLYSVNKNGKSYFPKRYGTDTRTMDSNEIDDFYKSKTNKLLHNTAPQQQPTINIQNNYNIQSHGTIAIQQPGLKKLELAITIIGLILLLALVLILK